jgi:hypothetical protein
MRVRSSPARNFECLLAFCAAGFSLCLALEANAQTAAFPIPDADAGEAAPAKPALSQQQSTAESLILEGVAARRAGREQDALSLFERAYSLHPSPRARAQMALAAKSLRLYAQAAQYFEEALAAVNDPWIVDNRETLEQGRDFVDKQLGWLVVQTSLPSVELFVNGRSVGAIQPANNRARVPAGILTVELRSPGYAPYRSTVSVPAQDVATLHARLEKEVAAPAMTPPAVVEHSKLPTLTYIGGAVALVGMGFGSYFGLRALDLKNDRDELCPSAACTSERGVELDEQGRTAATWSTLSFGVGLAGVATAVIAIATQRKTKVSGTRLSLHATESKLALGCGVDF